MEELNRFKKTCNRFQNSLLSSMEHFRKGEDHPGLDCLLNSMEDLESLLEYCRFSGKLKGKVEKIAPSMQALLVCMKNQDIVGMTDAMEFMLYPLAKEWFEGCDEK